ncbi:MerR family transcriptional regulator [Nocardia sp. NPDC088792]|uniref:MerR family transcriptional regulator n=1 Tax=Nocardia sp. NPDC088792 TaxID=3364332 RepID=UPI0038210F71
MAWSTRQLAQLAGTSVRAVRHYHDIGLLAEPERADNGYKLYGVAHLVRLLRIKRLADLGFSLTSIAELGDAAEHSEHALRALDAELAATIDRLQRNRVELARTLLRPTPAELPADLVAVAEQAGLSDTERALALVATRVLGPAVLEACTEMVRTYAVPPVNAELDRLPADAGERTRRDLAERLAPHIRRLHSAHPALRDITADAPHGADFALQTFTDAMADLYNAAQIDVLRRVAALVTAVPSENGVVSRRPRIRIG